MAPADRIHEATAKIVVTGELKVGSTITLANADNTGVRVWHWSILPPDDSETVEKFERPHGCELGDGRVICWGAADKWKTIVLAVHERCFGRATRKPFAAVFTQAAAHFGDPGARLVVEDAARRLGIHLSWWRDE